MTAPTEATRAPQVRLAHRPRPHPREPWVMRQSWRDLLFAHWPVPVEDLRRVVPPELEVDTHDGQAWVGLTPFRLTGLRARWLPPLPGLSSFPEVNLRTYVRARGAPGIYFFSLDAGSRLAVAGARALYGLPYHRARMRVRSAGPWVEFESARPDGRAALRCRYRPTTRPSHALPGSLEHFLVERYALFTVPQEGRVLRGDIHHAPWPLQEATAEIERNTVASAAGIALPDRPPLLHFAARQDTRVWRPRLHE